MHTTDPATTECPQYDPRTLLNSQPVIITVVDPSTYTVQFQNETGLHQFGNISGQACHKTIAGEATPCRFCLMPEAIEENRITTNEVPLPDGRCLLVMWSPARASDGRLHVIETIVDITERKQLEADLRQAQKMEAIGRLAGGIAHDFNNLLTVIKGQCEELLGGQLGGPGAHDQLQEIRRATERASKLTAKLMAFSRRQALQPEALQLNDALADMGDLLRRLIGEHVELVLEPAPGLGYVLADPASVEQVILNLVVNARDAMPAGGSIRLRTADVELDETFAQHHTGATPGSYVLLSVEDTGTGMDSETKDRIFEPFFTTKEIGKGTGLGLAIVYGFVKQSGGYVAVASHPGQGTRFDIYLPRMNATRPSASPAVPPPADGNGHETILLVEDERALRAMLAIQLRRRGYQVLEASDGVQAVQIADQHPSRIDLVISDVVMPRMKGVELVERLRTRCAGLKALYTSGYTGDAAIGVRALGGIPLLPKPFGPDELMRTIRQVLDGR